MRWRQLAVGLIIAAIILVLGLIVLGLSGEVLVDALRELLGRQARRIIGPGDRARHQQHRGERKYAPAHDEISPRTAWAPGHVTR